ncbi:glycoside hydrolase family 5 protein [Sphingorhabdus arenilitoris]|uniref:Glycoside hydrolase family 5 protein n=1 Tax=Sphingorhabdus arenilitoris TaxID=1490041 RepID=A0ABV8RDB6_9SPHN
MTQADARIGACINMGNQLEAPNEGDWGRAIRQSDFTDIAAKGFKTIRLPVRWSNHASRTAPYTIDAAFMTRVKTVVDQAQAANLRVILNVHHYDESGANVFQNPTGERARLAGIWKQIAEEFKDKSNNMLWFELLNEPHMNLNHTNLLATLQPSLDEIRKTNATRPVVIGGEFYSGVGSLNGGSGPNFTGLPLPIPNDPYIIATFHYYDPYNFTHQGAPWLQPNAPSAPRDLTQNEKDQITRDAQKVRDFMTRTGRPVFLGEYGVLEASGPDFNNLTTIPEAKRAEYYRLARTAFEGVDVDGCAWSYTNTFSVRRNSDDVWFDEILRAVGL